MKWHFAAVIFVSMIGFAISIINPLRYALSLVDRKTARFEDMTLSATSSFPDEDISFLNFVGERGQSTLAELQSKLALHRFQNGTPFKIRIDSKRLFSPAKLIEFYYYHSQNPKMHGSNQLQSSLHAFFESYCYRSFDTVVDENRNGSQFIIVLPASIPNDTMKQELMKIVAESWQYFRILGYTAMPIVSNPCLFCLCILIIFLYGIIC